MTEHNSCSSSVHVRQKRHVWLQLVEVLATRSWLRRCWALRLRCVHVVIHSKLLLKPCVKTLKCVKWKLRTSRLVHLKILMLFKPTSLLGTWQGGGKVVEIRLVRREKMKNLACNYQFYIIRALSAIELCYNFLITNMRMYYEWHLLVHVYQWWTPQ